MGCQRAIREDSRHAHSFPTCANFEMTFFSWFKCQQRENFPWRTKRLLSKWQVLLIEMCLHRTRADQVAQVADRST